jgi:glycosyltransferase involved in cell wall biosynthesis
MWNRPSPLVAGLRALAIVALMRLAGLRGIRCVWTIHNLQSHERYHPRIERWFWAAFTRRLDGYIALSTLGRDLARERFPALRRIPGFVVRHGHYRGAYPATVSREDARRRLGLPGGSETRVLAFVGRIRPYKDVPRLVRCLGASDDPDLRLVVAGRPSSATLEREVRDAAVGDERVRLFLGRIPEDEIQLYLRAADAVVLPYQEILNSGSALLALSFDRPVLVPDRGAMGELAELAGPGWVRTYQGELTPALLSAAAAWGAAARGRTCTELVRLDWDELAAQTDRAFRAVLDGAAPVVVELGSEGSAVS